MGEIAVVVVLCYTLGPTGIGYLKSLSQVIGCSASQVQRHFVRTRNSARKVCISCRLYLHLSSKA